MAEQDTKLITKTPPRCKQCRNIKEDDPKRMLFTCINEFDDEIAIIRCPSLKCGTGWELKYAPKHIIFESQDDITEEIAVLLKCKKEDIQAYVYIFQHFA